MLFTRTPAPFRGVVESTPKSIPEKLLRFFVAFKPNQTASSGSRTAPPIFHSYFDSDPFAAGPTDSYYAPYDDSSDMYRPQSRTTTSPPRLYQGTPAMQALPPKVVTDIKHSTVVNSQICQDVVKTQDDTVAAQSTSITKTCFKSNISPRSPSHSKNIGPTSRTMTKREIMQDFTMNALREAMVSRWLSEKAITKKSRAIMSEQRKRCSLPDLERFSTTKGLHGASRLGNGLQEKGLSYGKCHRTRDLIKSISSIFKTRGGTTPVTSAPPTQPKIEVPSSHQKTSGPRTSSSIRPVTPLPPYKPRYGVRCGREDWAKVVDITNQRSNQYPEHICDSQGRPIRSMNWI